MQLNSKLIRVFVFIVILILAYSIYSPAIKAPFTYEDEYEFLEIANGKKNYKTGVVKEIDFIDFQYKFIKLGRYAPTSMGIKYIKAKIFPKDSEANHIILIVIAAITSFLLFLIFIEFEVNIFLSLLGSILCLFAPWATIHIRLSTGESPGNLFLFLSVLLFIKYIKKEKPLILFLSFISVLLMSQCKESYTLLAPVLALCFIGYHAHFHQITIIESLKNTIKPALFIFALPFAIGVLGIALVIYIRGDVFAYGATKSYLGQALDNLVWLIKWLLPILFFLLISIYLYIKTNLKRPVFIGAFITIAWLGSQLVAYYNIKISFSQIRYLAPGGLILLFFSILSFQFLSQKYRKLYFLVSTLLILMIVKYAKLAYIDAGLFKANSVAYNKVMDFIASKKIESIAFYQGYEIVNSSFCQLNDRGYRPKIYASTTKLENEENKEFNNLLLNVLKDTYNLIEFDSILINNQIPKMLIISLPLPDNKDTPDRFIRNKFKEKILFTEKYNNVKFSDFIKPEFYRGQLGKDSVSYVTYVR
jgi:hypothetical protein